MSLVPIVVEQTNREKGHMTYIHVIKDRIIFLGEEINDITANL